MFPGYSVTTRTLVVGAAVTVLIGLFAGITPALMARRLKVIDALRATG
jgi:ABC-type antimicrobial peptide transport system permease subunit